MAALAEQADALAALNISDDAAGAAAAQGEPAAASDAADDADYDSMTAGPMVAILVGMAGSGKTTLFHRLHYYAEQAAATKKRCYFINLARGRDPAAIDCPIEPHIDIRDTVDYKGVMREYSLGPNGAIVTALNLFATQFADVMKILEKRAKEFDYIIVDTPGQIEAFTWSASGQLFAESLASTFATTVVYVVDTPRTLGPATFMSNMVYACSILHKLRLPLIAAFNKVDVESAETCFSWMDDFEKFHEALDADSTARESEAGGYITSLHRSMSLVLDEFYRVLTRVPVSAATGGGIPELFEKIDGARALYNDTYGAEIRIRLDRHAAMTDEERSDGLRRFEADYEPPEGPITGGM
ncbi:hypothetical protein M885DRAFT_622014 [Pelagophyceae sp. CCMP2097]|nr:hypothetical protein M885DRAFT_622014 [Pelagophyceae sp. CCMP2097]